MKIFKKMRIILSVLTLIFITGCFSFSPFATEIENGFSKELKSMLIRRYELNIPSNAEFIKGFYDNAFQDNSVYISFTIAIQDFNFLTSDNWVKSDSSGGDWYKDLFDNDISLENRLEFQNELYTVLLYSEPDGEGIITCAFCGRYPGETIK